MRCEPMAWCQDRIVDGKLVKHTAAPVKCGTSQLRPCCPGGRSHFGLRSEEVAILGGIALLLSLAAWWVFHKPRPSGQVAWKEPRS
ncbi:MAG: hypothetical protein AAB074_14265 [Planctomycetota bacterium]